MDPIKHIRTEKYGEDKDDKLKKEIQRTPFGVKPDLSNITSRLTELAGLLHCEGSITDPQSLLDLMIAKVKAVPYIQYPVSFSTVDMIAISSDFTKVLLGKKYKQTQWQFPGGFRDAGETSRIAASREMHEEAQILVPFDKFKFIGDMVIDDERYRNSPHKITTNIYVVYLDEEQEVIVKGGDDLEFVQWFDIDDVEKNKDTILRKIHHKLLEHFLQTLS